MSFSKVVNLRFKSFLPGAGYNSAGSPVQGKTHTRGTVVVTDYERGGTDLKLQEMGLNAADDVQLKLRDPVRGPDPVNNLREVVYSVAASQFYVYEWRQDHQQFYLGGADRTLRSFQGIREVPGGTDLTVSWDAFGDAVTDVELT